MTIAVVSENINTIEIGLKEKPKINKFGLDKWPKRIHVLGRAEAVRDFAGQKLVKSENELPREKCNDLFQSQTEETGNISNTHRAEEKDFKS